MFLVLCFFPNMLHPAHHHHKVACTDFFKFARIMLEQHEPRAKFVCLRQHFHFSHGSLRAKQHLLSQHKSLNAGKNVVFMQRFKKKTMHRFTQNATFFTGLRQQLIQDQNAALRFSSKIISAWDAGAKCWWYKWSGWYGNNIVVDTPMRGLQAGELIPWIFSWNAFAKIKAWVATRFGVMVG